MKKLLLPICAMLLCVTACKKEENNGILRLEIEHFSSDSKLHLDAAHFAVWDNNDEVLLNGVRKPVLISNGTATISDVATADNYTAVYPSSWASSTTSITYPEFQFNHDGRVIAPMAATYDGEKLKFKNLGAILAVNVNTSMTVDRIEVIADDASISGTFPISYNSRPSIGTPTPTDGKNMTTLVCDSVVTGSATFYIALPPVTTKLTIKVFSGNTLYSKTQNNAFTLQPNHGYSVSLSDFNSYTDAMPANNQIFYTASSKIDDNILSSAFGSTIESHTFNETIGQYIVTFSGEINWINFPSFDNSYFSATGLTSITLPASVTTIDNFAFKDCSSLTSVMIPEVTFIRSKAFYGCSSLTTISMPKVITIESYAFESCSSLTTISMPKVTLIGDLVFFACYAIKNVYCTSSSDPTVWAYAFQTSAARLHLSLNQYNTLTWSHWPGETYWDL